MTNGVEISKNNVKIALSKNTLQHHILNTNPIYQFNNKHNNRIQEKKPFCKKKKKKRKKKEKEKYQIFEDKNWTRGLVVGKSKYFH